MSHRSLLLVSHTFVTLILESVQCLWLAVFLVSLWEVYLLGCSVHFFQLVSGQVSRGHFVGVLLSLNGFGRKISE